MKLPQAGETGLVIMPPPELRNEINMWRRVYHAYVSTVTPHITLCYPFIPINIWDSNRQAIFKALQGIRPFDIKFRELGTFVRDESVLWLKPENGKNLSRIRMKIQELFSEYLSQSALAYVPHLTIGFFNSVDDLLEARKSVQKQLKPLQFTVNKVIFAAFEEKGWRIHDHINLQ